MTDTTVFYSLKGGQGTTTAACGYALLKSQQHPVLLIDLAGDCPAALGMSEPFKNGTARATETLFVHVGMPEPDSREWQAWDEIIIDAGVIHTQAEMSKIRIGRMLLVTKACYMAARRGVALGTSPDGIILFEEPSRALGMRDMERCLGANVIACIAYDPAVARCIDAGLLATRLPRNLSKNLAHIDNKEEATT